MSAANGDFSVERRCALLRHAVERACGYLRDLDTRRVAPEPAAVVALGALGGALPESPEAPESVVALLDSIGAPATVLNASGRYFGFVTGSGLPAGMAAQVLMAAWDQNSAFEVMSPVGARLEEIALEWVRAILGLPEGCGGALVTGATMASFTGLAAARHALLARAGWDVEADGMAGAPALQVVAGAEVHASLLKAVAMLGLGRERVIRVPVDGQGRMRADAVPALTGRTILCLQAGNVNTGAFDPAAEIIPAAREAGAWVHVDGAFGMWAAASAKYRHLLKSYELADSWATDAHKWPNAGYDCGIALVRDAAQLRGAMAISAAYLLAADKREPMHYGPESSRRARGIELWAVLRSLGRRGLAELVERSCAHAGRLADLLARAGCRILNEVVLNQVLVSFGTAEVTREVIRRIQEDGTCWCGGTVWQGQAAMRISVSSWATTERDVERCAAAIVKAASDAGAA